jgi:hypothetical protein
MLSFLPAEERLRSGQVNKQWRIAMMPPSLWSGQGWHFTRYVNKANAFPLPPWLVERLSVVRCSTDWLVHAAPFERFRQLKNVRHLDLLRGTLASNMAATDEAALRCHLSSLPLLSLGLPLHASGFPPRVVGEPVVVRDPWQPLLSAFIPPSSHRHARSPLTGWSPHLTHLRCAVRLLPDDPMLALLNAQQWPVLRKLQLTLHCTGSRQTYTTLEQLRRAILPGAMPALSWLEVGCYCKQWWPEPSCDCNGWSATLLRGISALTNLKLSFAPPACQQVNVLELFRLVSADAMPLLTQLTVDRGNLLPMPDGERAATIAFLQRMPLTQLDCTGSLHMHTNLPLLNHLPHLSVCTLIESCDAESVAAVPSLTELACIGSDLMDVAVRWWRRRGCPPLQYVGFVDEDEWQQHLAARAGQPTEAAAEGAVQVVRTLRCGPYVAGLAAMSPFAFPYLAHLAQLRELECCLEPKGIRALGLLLQLESLRVWVLDTPSPSRMPAWRDNTVRTLGNLPLDQLRSLRLEGDDGHPRMTGSMRPKDPDYPCQKNKQTCCCCCSTELLSKDIHITSTFTGLFCLQGALQVDMVLVSSIPSRWTDCVTCSTCAHSPHYICRGLKRAK